MGVLIEGMEMPKTESEVLIIAIKSDGSVYPVRIDGDGNPMIFQNEEMQNRAVPVPEPHGRLIDADVLAQRIDDESEKFYAMNEYDSGLRTGYRASMRAAKLAPTVIPASGDG